jgi:hypothetical protein
MHATKWFKCVCCSEQIRTDELYIAVVNDSGKIVKGERYCLDCEDYAIENNDIIDNTDDGESHLRSMEDYAAYQAAGCTSEYWSDRDNGFCN